MKKFILILILLFCALMSYSQTNMRTALRANVYATSGSSPFFDLQVIVADDLSKFDATFVTTGDYIYVLDGSFCWELEVDTVLFQSGNLLQIRVYDQDSTLITVPNGQAAIVSTYPNYDLPFYVSSLRDELQSCVIQKLVERIDNIVGSAFGQNNIGGNLGTGAEVYEGKLDSALLFRTLVNGDNVTINQSATELEINSNATLSFGNDTLSISNGNSVIIPIDSIYNVITNTIGVESVPIKVYLPAHGFTLPAKGYIPINSEFNQANASNVDSVQVSYIIDVPHPDTIVVVTGGIITTGTYHGLDIGALYYLQDNGSETTADTATVSSSTAFVLDSITIALREIGVILERYIPIRPIPSPVITAYGGNPLNPSDSIIGNIVNNLYKPLGLAIAGTIYTTPYAGASQNTRYQNSNPLNNSYNPSNAWIYDGKQNVVRLKEKLFALNLEDSIFSFQTLIPITCYTDSCAKEWFVTNYANNIKLPNGFLGYVIGSGTVNSPEHVWFYTDNHNLSFGDGVIRLAGNSTWLKPELEAGNVTINNVTNTLVLTAPEMFDEQKPAIQFQHNTLGDPAYYRAFELTDSIDRYALQYHDSEYQIISTLPNRIITPRFETVVDSLVLRINSSSGTAGQVPTASGNGGTFWQDLPPSTDTSGYNLAFSVIGDSLVITDGDGILAVARADIATPPDLTNYVEYSDSTTVFVTPSMLNDTATAIRGDFPVNTDTSGYNLQFWVENDSLKIRDGNSTLTLPSSDIAVSPDSSIWATLYALSDTAITLRNLIQVGGSESCTYSIVQTGHGFSSLTPIYWDGIAWSSVVGIYGDSIVADLIVIDSISADTFLASSCGVYNYVLTDGDYYQVDTAPGYQSSSGDTLTVILFSAKDGKIIVNPILGFEEGGSGSALQTLSISNDTLSISGGNSVIIPIGSSSIDSTLAANGVTLSGDTVILGGTLNQSTTITGGAFGLAVTRNSTSLTLDGGNLGAGGGVRGYSLGGGRGLTAQSTTSATNTRRELVGLISETSGTAANGFGAHIGTYLETASGSLPLVGRFGWEWGNAHNDTVRSTVYLQTTNGTANLNDVLKIDYAGQLSLPQYTTNTFIGTGWARLAVDANGVVVADTTTTSGGGIDGTLADNGLTMSGDTVILGGTLNKNTTIAVGTNTLTVSGTGVSPHTALTVTGATSGNSLGVTANGTGSAISASQAGTGTTISASSTSGTAVNTVSATGSAIRARVNPTTTNSVVESIRMLRGQGTGTAANGAGVSLGAYIISDNASDRIASSIQTSWSNVVDSVRTAQFDIYTTNLGTNARKLSLSGPGQLTLDGYTTNTFIGTGWGKLTVSASGVVVVDTSKVTSITAPVISSTQNDYAPTGWVTANIIRIFSDSLFHGITSFSSVGLTNGHEKTILNVGDYPFYIAGEHPDGTAANRVRLRKDFILYPGSVMKIIYDSIPSRWMVIGISDDAETEKSVVYNFAAGSTTTGDHSLANFAAINSGSVTNSNPPSGNQPGSHIITPLGTTDGGGYISFRKGTPNTFAAFGYAHIQYNAHISLSALSDDTDAYLSAIGITSAPVGTNVIENNSVWVQYTHSDNAGKWTLYSRDATTTSSGVDLGVTVEALKTYNITLVANTERSEVRAYINGVYRGRVTTNLPVLNTGLGARVIHLKTAGINAKVLYLHSMNAKSIYPF